VQPADPPALLGDLPLLSHLINITTQALDVGALKPILWAFEERVDGLPRLPGSFEPNRAARLF
jgi:hypothetical protein